MKRIIICLSILLTGIYGICQVPVTEIYGTVINCQKTPLDSVEVKIVNYNLPTVFTNKKGEFVIQVKNDKTNINTKSILFFEFSKAGFIKKSDTLQVDGEGLIHNGKPILIHKKLLQIHGKIIDQQGVVLDGLCIQLPEFGNVIKNVKTDNTGEFILDVSSPGINIHAGKKLAFDIYDSECKKLIKKVTKAPNCFGTIYQIVYAKCRPGEYKDLPSRFGNLRCITDIECNYIPVQPFCPDTDQDGVCDKYDRCPCEKAYTKNGCPRNFKKQLSKLIPGLSDKEFHWTVLFVGGGVMTYYGIKKWNQYDDMINSALSANKIIEFEEEKDTWKNLAIAGGATMAASYFFDNIFIKKDESCIDIASNDDAIGMSLIYKF
ncbi:MAG: hypothetical protein AAFZ15_27615 [Bacteroidota bacterium]